MIESKFIAIVGPTASGKSALALRLAEELSGEIVSCDSVQVYKGFDIGSAKPRDDEQKAIRHHLIDILDPTEKMDAAVYAQLAQKAVSDIISRGRVPILAGGTGLYLRALCGEKFHDLPTDPDLKKNLSELSTKQLREELLTHDPERAQQIHENDHFRHVRAVEIFRLTSQKMSDLTKEQPQISSTGLVWSLDLDRALLHNKIEQRTDAMLHQGLVEEVENLLSQGCPQTAWPFQSIGYKQVLEHLEAGKVCSVKELKEKIVIATRQYAKRQCTWFRKYNQLSSPIIEKDWENLIKVCRQHLELS